MHEHDDASLLSAFAGAGSEKAFAEIARRYASLIYHAGLRRTGRAELAQEAAQNTLAILARKAARIDATKTLAPWLYRTALYEASKIRRRERRHEDRMKLFHAEAPAALPSEDSWDRALPHLDEAMQGLSESDRQVVMLKYFSGWTFEQMAERLGGKSTAWRQRGSRAVERLRRFFAKRGPSLPTATIMAGLAGTFTQSAPAAVLGAMTVMPHAAATALSWKTLTFHSLHLMNAKQIALVASVAVATLIPLGYQYNAVSQVRSRVALLETSVQALRPPSAEATPTSLLASGRRPAARANVVGVPVDLVAWADALIESRGGDFMKMLPVQKALNNMSVKEVEGLLLNAAKLDISADKKGALLQHLYGHFLQVNKDHRLSLELAMKLKPDCPSSMGISGLMVQASPSLGEWAKTDPAAALTWFRDQKSQGALEGKGLHEGTMIEDTFSASLFTVLMKAKHAEAMSFWESLPTSGKTSALSALGSQSRSSEERQAVLDLARTLPDAASRNQVLSHTAMALGGKSLDEAGQFIRQAALPAKETRDLMIDAARGNGSSMRAEELTERVAWLRKGVDPAEQEKAVGYFLGEYAANTMSRANARQALEAELAKGTNEELLGAYVRRSITDPRSLEEGLKLAMTIQDATLRERTIREAMQRLPATVANEVAKKFDIPTATNR